MDKKTYVLKVLELVKNTMPLARGLIILLKETDIDEKFLDVLIKSFQEAIDKIEDEDIKQKLIKTKEFLEKLRLEEERDRVLDEEYLKRLDKILENI